MTKRIGVLTSGGDCPGLNAAIRAIVLRSIRTYGWKVFGVRQGTNGFLHRPVEMKEFDLSIEQQPLLTQGGTILGTTNRGNPFFFPVEDGSTRDLSDLIVEGFEKSQLDALITIGVDGSMAILKKLSERGRIPIVAIPKTIDNDLGSTELSIGFRTAVDVAVEALDRLQPTALSHDRIMILEVMGRDAGHIAIEAGIGGGADVILIPEIAFSIDVVMEKITNMKKAGINHALIIAAEAARMEGTPSGKRGGIGDMLAQALSSRTSAECRVTVLGHVQRGARPSAQDRILASALGVHATDLLHQGKYGRMVTWCGGVLGDVSIEEAIARYQSVDPQGSMVKTARSLGICLGDKL